jgi:CheY-specific phosphatase CheX
MVALDVKSGLDAVLVNSIIAATNSVFSTMVNTPVSVKEIRAQAQYASSGDLSAVIGILGEKGEGMMSLSFSTEQANVIVARLLGSSPEGINADDRCDGIGELVNMISGNTKTALSRENGSSYTLSLPTVIVGKGHEVQVRPKNCPYLLILFDMEGYEFGVQVTFKFNQ